MRTLVLVNPIAGSGAAARCAPDLARALAERGVDAEVRHTERPGDAASLVHRARDEGVECVAVVGGDGTLNEVSQAYLGPEGEFLPGPDLALVPCGTGGDFRKTFKLTTSLDDAVERIVKATPQRIDLGSLELTSHEGQAIRRAFLNITSFGIGGLTDQIVNRSHKWLGGRAAFFLGALRALASYENAPVRVEVDGVVRVESPIVNVIVANGRYFGGGMLIAPDADPRDGLLDVVVLGNLTRLQNLSLAPQIYRGTHVGREQVSAWRGKVVRAVPIGRAENVLIDMDGETPGRLPLTARLWPGAVGLRI